MGRILFWVGLAVIIWAVIVLGRKRRVEHKQEKRQETCKREASEQGATVRMQQCPICGTHFPEDEAVLGNGVAYCSEKCRGKARRQAFDEALHGKNS